MAAQLVTVTSNYPGASTLTLVDGTTSTGYSMLYDPPPEFGNVVWQTAFSGPRGTQGARAAYGVPENRALVFALLVEGTSKDDAASKISTLQEVADQLRRFGGRVKWRSKNQTYAQYFEVMSGSCEVATLGVQGEALNQPTVMFSASCAPYLLGDPYDITDDFSTDRLSEYTFDSGASSNVLVTSGILDAAANLTTENRAIHTATGYTVLDDGAGVKFTPGATITSFKAGVALRGSASDTYIDCYVDDNGTNSRLRIDVVIGGSRTNRASTNLAARVSDGTPGWVFAWIERNTVYIQHWTSEPTPMGSPTNSTSYSPLTSAEQTSLVAGQAGWVWTPQHTTATLDDFIRRPFWYRNLTLPDEITLKGSLLGDAPPLCETTFTMSGGSAAPIWMGFAWAKRPEIFNWCWNGDSEEDTNGWTATADGVYVTSSSGTISRVTSEFKYGTASLQLVTTSGAALQGTGFKLYRTFRKGVTYTATFWAKGTANSLRAHLGDPTATSESGVTFTPGSSWAQQTITWTPTANYSTALFSVRTQGATAGTYQFDGVVIYEGATAPSVGKHSEGKGAYPPFGILEAEACDAGDLSNWAITADANARSGFQLEYTTAGAGTASATWFVDPHLMVPDDFTQGELHVLYFARIEADGDLVSPKLTLSAVPEAGTNYGTERYSDEWGSSGKLIVENSGTGTVFRTVGLGSLRFTVDRTRPVRWKVKVAATFSAGSAGAFNLDHLWQVPTASFACSPTAQANDSFYPDFVSSTNETSKTIRSDGSGLVAKPPGYQHPDHGLGGAPLEFPTGDVDVTVRPASLVPDDPTSDTTTEQEEHNGTVHLALTPRWHFIRDA